MHTHYLQIKAHNAVHLLPRLLMAIARRRVEIREMHLVNDGQYWMQLTLRGEDHAVDGVVRQLRKVIEVEEVVASAAGATELRAVG